MNQLKEITIPDSIASVKDKSDLKESESVSPTSPGKTVMTALNMEVVNEETSLKENGDLNLLDTPNSQRQ